MLWMAPTTGIAIRKCVGSYEVPSCLFLAKTYESDEGREKSGVEDKPGLSE